MEKALPILFKKLIENKCSPEEVDLVLQLLTENKYKHISKDTIYKHLANPANEEQVSEEIRKKLNKRLESILSQEENTKPLVAAKKIRRLDFIKYAAAILFIMGTGLYFFFYRAVENIYPDAQETILPGGNKAVLTLADGRKIILNDSINGEIAEQAGLRITKSNNGQIVYHATGSSVTESVGNHTIETPKGGQYQIILPDGSKAWLNASSSISFPVNFSKAQRNVDVKGEVYFEVEKLPGSRFIVNTVSGEKTQTVEVLGTHFNINAYDDENAITTTLIEGSVRVTNKGNHTENILLPGEQSGISSPKSAITVKKVDTEQVIAWKNGYFTFDRENIQSIMRKISRWYDVEIEYEGDISQDWFAGNISKYKDVSQVLRKLELTGQIKFRVTGRKIIVSK